MELLLNDLEAAIMATDDQEISTRVIGDEVMRRLRELDEVAYIRFASVYRSFADIGKLREAVDELLDNPT
jgi:transcriptional repressor NrdR